MKIIILFFTVCLSLFSQNQSHLELGIPLNPNQKDLVIKQIANDTLLYVVGFNETLNVANWVCWNLSKDWYGNAKRYSSNFIADKSLKLPIQHSDYTNSGFDRGHLVRSEERSLSNTQNKATFRLTNIIPQTPDLNRKIWLNLEQFCEELCKLENKELYIIAGGIYKSKKQIESKVTIPDTCYKIIVVLDKGQCLNNVDTNTKVIAVKIPNIQGIKGSYAQYLCTVDDIEASTGYDYLNLVRNEIQGVVEGKVYRFAKNSISNSSK